MMKESPQHHLLNGPTQADVGKTEGGEQIVSVSKANPRQMRGVNKHISERQEAEETEQSLAERSSNEI